MVRMPLFYLGYFNLGDIQLVRAKGGADSRAVMLATLKLPLSKDDSL